MRPLNRTYSSPNLQTNRLTNLSSRGPCHSHDDSDFFVIGDRVRVDGRRLGSVAYFGDTEFGHGDWVGLVLDEPTGNHDGKLHGRQYFQCAPNHGLFVRAHRVKRIPDSALGSSLASSGRGTPLPSANNYQRFRYNTNNNSTSSSNPSQTRSSSRASTGSSLLDSYYYDDDYRQDQAPTVASLARKLKSIEERTQREMEETDLDRERPASRSQTPIGILKHAGAANRWRPDGDASHLTTGTSLSSRVDELGRRLRASSVSPGSRSQPVFNFRPKREQMDLYEPNGRKQRLAVHLAGLGPPRKGDRVLIRTERDGQLAGLLRFMGETNFATGEWAGVELDEPVGKNDGSILGCRYFHCPPNYGLFVPASRVKKYDPDKHEVGQQSSALDRLYGSQPSIFSSMRSTIKSPPPRLTSLSRLGAASSSSRSTTPSYNMDTLSPISRHSSSMSVGDKTSDDYSRSTSSPLRTTNLDDLYTRAKGLPHPPQRSSHNRETFKSTTNGSYDDWHPYSRAKFDDDDIELKLRQSLNRSRSSVGSPRSSQLSSSSMANRPKAVEYTFISSKLNGEPIARRTLIYE